MPTQHSDPPFPPARAFVIQLPGGELGDDVARRGRVEHLHSGRSRRFESAEELLEFLRLTLASAEENESQPRGSSQALRRTTRP